MKRSAYVFALASIMFAECRPTIAESNLGALRKIRIEQRTMLMLGGQMPQPSNFCIWSGRTCTLKPGTFGGAKAMSLRETESGLIYELRFDYGVLSDDAVKTQIDNYVRHFGKPSIDSTVKDGEFNVHSLEWSDPTTTFDLSYKTGRNQTEGSAKLFDKALAGSAQ